MANNFWSKKKEDANDLEKQARIAVEKLQTDLDMVEEKEPKKQIKAELPTPHNYRVANRELDGDCVCSNCSKRVSDCPVTVNTNIFREEYTTCDFWKFKIDKGE